MSRSDDPAFPTAHSPRRSDGTTEPLAVTGGMSLREYYAINILQGIISCPEIDRPNIQLVRSSIVIADMLIDELNKKQTL